MAKDYRLEIFKRKYHAGYYDDFLDSYFPRWNDIADMSPYECRLFDRLLKKYKEEHKWKNTEK